MADNKHTADPIDPITHEAAALDMSSSAPIPALTSEEAVTLE